MATLEALKHKKDSAVAVDSSGLNPAQLHLLQLCAHIRTDDTLRELKRLIRDHYARQLQNEADRHWAEGKLSDDLLKKHLRTEYK